MEEHAKGNQEKIDALKEERDHDLKQHEKEMADKERKLQEFFIKKLDRKLTRVQEDHQKGIEGLNRSHDH